MNKWAGVWICSVLASNSAVDGDRRRSGISADAGIYGVPAILSEYGFDFAHRRPKAAVHGGVDAPLAVWAEENKESRRDAAGGLGAGLIGEFLVKDRCAASCSAGSTPTPRAGLVSGIGKVVSVPASWPLLPLRDGRRFACGIGICRSPFALCGEGRTGNFNVGRGASGGEAFGIRGIVGSSAGAELCPPLFIPQQ